MYKIVRVYFNGRYKGDGWRRTKPSQTIKTGLTLEQADAHIRDPEHSSALCTTDDAKRITIRNGEWYDSYRLDTH